MEESSYPVVMRGGKGTKKRKGSKKPDAKQHLFVKMRPPLPC